MRTGTDSGANEGPSQRTLDERIAECRIKLREQPHDLRARIALAEALSAAGSWEEAAVEFRKVMEQDTDNIQAAYEMGRALERAGDPEGAEDAYRSALRRSPEHESAHFRLGVLLNIRGAFKEAKTEFRWVTQQNRRHVSAMYNLGVALQGLDRREAAKDAYLAALRMRPGHAASHTALAGLFELEGKKEEAEREYRAALSTDPEDPQAALGLAWAIFGRAYNTRDRGLLEASADAFRRALHLRPGNASGLLELSRVEWERGAKETAISLLKEAVDADTHNHEVRSELAQKQVRAGKWIDGVRSWRALARTLMSSPASEHQGIHTAARTKTVP